MTHKNAKEIFYRKYKEVPQISQKNTNNPNEKCAKDKKNPFYRGNTNDKQFMTSYVISKQGDAN